MTNAPEIPPEKKASPKATAFKRRFMMVVRLALLFAVLFAANRGAAWLVEQVDPEALVAHQRMVFGIVAATLLLYAVLIAIPFVPGVEIGIGLFVVLGGSMAPFVYLATLVGLSLAFFAGRVVSLRRLEKFFKSMSFDRAGTLVARLAPLSRAERLSALMEGTPSRWMPFLLRHRYISLAIAVNVPGNSLVGGGGGICLLAGMSGLFSYRAFLLTLAVAVVPVPIFVFFFGTGLIFSQG